MWKGGVSSRHVNRPIAQQRKVYVKAKTAADYYVYGPLRRPHESEPLNFQTNEVISAVFTQNPGHLSHVATPIGNNKAGFMQYVILHKQDYTTYKDHLYDGHVISDSEIAALHAYLKANPNQKLHVLTNGGKNVELIEVNNFYNKSLAASSPHTLISDVDSAFTTIDPAFTPPGSGTI
jgi:hypothetical protein